MKDCPICPSCGTLLVEYRIPFNRGLARFLGKLFDAGGPAEIRSLGLDNALYSYAAKIHHWEVAEPYITPETDRKRGWWKITPKGVQFVSGLITVPRFAVTKQGALVRFEGDEVSFDSVSDGYLCRADYVEQVRRQLLHVGDDGQYHFKLQD